MGLIGSWTGPITLLPGGSLLRLDGTGIAEIMVGHTLIFPVLHAAIVALPPKTLVRWTLNRNTIHDPGTYYVERIGLPQVHAMPDRSPCVWIGEYNILPYLRTFMGFTVIMTLGVWTPPAPVGRQILWEDDE
jgi:hypothetical protein